MFKKVVALVLVFALSMSIVSSAFANEITDFSEDSLRVSDEFVAQYPSGAFSLSAVAMETNEYSGRSVIKVIRQGGIDGNISVKIKAIDITTKYGQDYSLSLPGFIFDTKIEGSETTTPPAISVIEQDGGATTTPAAILDTGSTEMSPPETSVMGPTEEVIIEAPKSRGLLEARQQATGKISDREKLALPNIEEQEQINTATAAANNYYAEAPGTVFNLSFENGERTKSFNLDIINDNIPEAQEQLIFVITEVSAGGVIGLQKETTVNIIDDEPYEMPLLGFKSHSFTAAEEVAKVTLTRTAGINYYAGASISTLGDSARAGTDYTELGQKILFVPGQTELSLEIPIVKNESIVDKYFYVKLEPDNGCAISGDEVVQVQIPAKIEGPETFGLMSDSSLMVVPEGVMLGVPKQTINYTDLKYAGGNNCNQFIHSSGWNELNIKGNQANGTLVTRTKYYLGNLESVFATFELFDLGHHGDYNASTVHGRLHAQDYVKFSTKLAYGKNKSEVTTNTKENKLTEQIYSRSLNLKKYYQPLWVGLYVTNSEDKRDKAALRAFSLEINFRKYEFDIQNPQQSMEYVFDFSKSTNNYTSEYVRPGEIEITNLDDQPIKGFYTSSDTTTFEIKTKKVREGYHLTGVKFLKSYAPEAGYHLFDMKSTNIITLDSKWMLDNAGTFSLDGKFIVQPIFERNKAKLTVNISDTDTEKGEIVNVVNSSTPSKTFEKDNMGGYTLYVNDKVIITGVGNKDHMVTGYNVSYNGGRAKSEAGATSAGIHTITLTEKVTVSPIFGVQLLNVKRDPDNKAQFPNVQGNLNYGTTISNGDGELKGIKSGQYIEFVSIPPVGYMTQWANRTGDVNGNGILDYEELYDPKTKRLYRQYDYDMDGRLDAEYDAPMFGDLFGYKVNQPKPLFYYYYTPIAAQTTFNGKVIGSVYTREYTIRQGYAKYEDANGELVDSFVPVTGAVVKMGGSYDRNNPDSQMGYGTSTSDSGLFEFNFVKLVKNAYYPLSVHYNGVPYIDKINPSFSKQVILPTFTSMKPISINAIPRGGQDKNVVSGSIVMINDKTVNFNLITAALENNVKVQQAIFRIYSSEGTLMSSKTETATANNAVLSVNLNDDFTPNARLTVQLVDQNGNQSMEYNTGFQFRPPMKATSLLPAFAAPNQKTIPIVESVMGALDFGLARFTDTTPNDDGYTLYVGAAHQFDEHSKELKNTIDEAKEGDADSTAAKKKITDANKDAPKKEDSNLKVKSTLTENLGVKVSLEMNIKYDKKRDPKIGSPYYFGHLMLMVTFSGNLTSGTRIVLPIGLSVILNLEIGGSVTGYIYITPFTPLGEVEPIKVYADQYGNYPYYKADPNDSNRQFTLEGGIILEPYIKLSVGAEYGIATVSVKTSALFHLVFSTAKSGHGTVTLTSDVTVTALGFEIYNKNITNWSTSLFGTSSGLMDQMLGSDEINQREFESIPREYLNNRTPWQGELLSVGNPGPSMTDYTEKTLMEGVYPYPDPQLMRIDKDSILLVFIEDNLTRDSQNRGALYYCISHDNGATFSAPVILDNDGTLDSQPRLKDMGSKIVCLYSSLDAHITDGMSMEDILKTNSLEMAIFDKATGQFGEPIDVTKYTGRINQVDGSMEGDYYSDVDGNVIFDESRGQVLIFYTKTDFTSDSDENLSAQDLFENYGAVTYMIYDINNNSFLPYSTDEYPPNMTSEAAIQWNADWYGQRFLNTEIVDASLPGGGISDPLILDLTAQERNDTAYIAYTVDLDGNMETLEDRDIYMQTYKFLDKTFSAPIKMSDLEKGSLPKSDGKPKLVLYNGYMHLFYTADTAVYYYNLDKLLGELSTMVPTASPGELGYESLAPSIALGHNKDNLPTDDYEVLVGDDGKLYLIWTEETLRLADGVEPGSQESLLPENSFHENQIYGSVLYDILVDPSAEKETYIISDDYGKWGEKVQITVGPGSYDNMGVSIMENGHIIAVAKKSEKILLNDTPASPRIENASTVELVAMTMTPIAQAEMKQDSINFGTEFPLPGELTEITATVNNHGLVPFLKPIVDFYAIQGETETYIDSRIGSAPVYGGTQATFDVHWLLPEEILDVKIVAKLRTDGSDSVIAQSERAVPYGAKLEYGLFNVDYIAENYFRTYIEVHHKGNQPLVNSELIINRIDSDKIAHELNRVSISNETEALDMFIINEGFEMSKQDIANGSADIEVRIESNDKVLVKQTATVEKNLPSLYQELIADVTSVELSTKEMKLYRGTRGTITAKASPVEADQMNNIVYVSSNPAVATVNSAGEIIGLMSGNATITAYAVPKVDVTLHTTDGYVISGDILDTLALEDCKSDTVTVTVITNDNSPSVPKDEIVPGVATILANSDKPVSITQNGHTVEFGPKAITELLNGAKSEKLTLAITKLEATDKAQMYAISLKCGDNPVTSLKNTDVKISIPYTLKSNENPNAVVAYRVTEKGVLEAIPNCSYKNGMLTFTTSDFTEFGIGHNLRSFTDVAENAWYADAITFIAARGISAGIGNNQFAPEKLMTREEFAKFIVTALGFSWSGKPSGFSDVKQGSWYEKSVGALYEAGIISGTGKGQFGTNQYITRQDMAKILYAALQKKGIAFNKTRDYTGFKDDSNISDYAASAIKALYEAGIISGIGNSKLAPSANASRSNMAAVLKKALELN